MTSTDRPRVLICEDSRTYAAALQRVIEFGGELDVVGVSRTAEDAVAAMARFAPDLVTMDIELPGMSGLEAVERIMNAAPVPILVLSGTTGPGSHASAAALAAGALEALPKDAVNLLQPGGAEASAFRQRLIMLSRTRVIRHPRGRHAPRAASHACGSLSARAIGICSSMGGPHALLELLGALPGSFPIPILIAQHMTSGFVGGLAEWLDASVPLGVHLARAGALLEPGAWLAPDDMHLLLDPGPTVTLRPGTASDLHVPSGDILLRSLAARLGQDAVSVVLTGMGRDGAAGTAAVKAAGGFAIAQDAATSVIDAMPRAAAEHRIDRILPLGRIAAELCDLSRREIAA